MSALIEKYALVVLCLAAAIGIAGRALAERELAGATSGTHPDSANFDTACSSNQFQSSDWPCWRGPAGDNHSRDEQPPLEWSADKNILWKTSVPGRGHASPCVVGGKIFLASSDDAKKSQFLLCFDRERGEQLWCTELYRGELPQIHANNSHASATPASDGSAVYVAFANHQQLTVSAVGMDGTIRWQRKAGDYQHANGYGASPVVFRNLIIVANDNQIEPSLVALDRANGEIVWKTTRPKSDNSATPVVAVVAGSPQLLLNGAKRVSSYDPLRGNEIWHADHNTEVAACTMAFDDDSVYASGNVPEKNLLCVRADGRGNVTETHIDWDTNRLVPYVPSPLRVDEHLLAVTDSGLAWCRETGTGKVIWQQRLGGSFFSSPVLAGGNIYATSEAGETYIFRATAEFELVAKNEIGEACMATPAICGGRIYLRSFQHLYCIETAGLR
jgi:outer membrane protein assembly factor BamB